jgi:hypothetical protein
MVLDQEEDWAWMGFSTCEEAIAEAHEIVRRRHLLEQYIQTQEGRLLKQHGSPGSVLRDAEYLVDCKVDPDDRKECRQLLSEVWSHSIDSAADAYLDALIGFYRLLRAPVAA